MHLLTSYIYIYNGLCIFGLLRGCGQPPEMINEGANRDEEKAVRTSGSSAVRCDGVRAGCGDGVYLD